MNTAAIKLLESQIRAIQTHYGLKPDGIAGAKTWAAIYEDVVGASAPSPEWHHVKASSFADPVDIRAFKKCKAQGKTDQQCFKVGDNGIGKWGDDTTRDFPMCALPPDDWGHLPEPKGMGVVVEANGRMVTCSLADTMPRKKNIKNGAGIDLNPAACKALGLTPPIMVDAKWRWA